MLPIVETVHSFCCHHAMVASNAAAEYVAIADSQEHGTSGSMETTRKKIDDKGRGGGVSMVGEPMGHGQAAMTNAVGSSGNGGDNVGSVPIRDETRAMSRTTTKFSSSARPLATTLIACFCNSANL